MLIEISFCIKEILFLAGFTPFIRLKSKIVSNETELIGRTLSVGYYTDPEYFAAECDRIFGRGWFCVGRTSDLEAAGDYIALDLLGRSIILVRGHDGRARAFYNVCRHRGCALMDPTACQPASRASLRRRYHSSVYDFDGADRRTPRLHGRSQLKNRSGELSEMLSLCRRKPGSLDYDEEVPHHEGAVTYTFSGQTSRRPFPGLNEAERVNHKGHLVLPNLMVSANCDHVVTFILMPRSESEIRSDSEAFYVSVDVRLEKECKTLRKRLWKESIRRNLV